MIHIINFVINPEYNRDDEKANRRHLRLLPTVSKEFRSIMGNHCFDFYSTIYDFINWINCVCF